MTPMIVPGTRFALAVLLVLILPGIVYGAVRSSVRGLRHHDRDIAARILGAVTVGVSLDAVYVLMLGSAGLEWLRVNKAGAPEHPRATAVLVLGLGVLLPAARAYVVQGKLTIRDLEKPRLKVRRFLLPSAGFQSTPTAWDFAAPRLGSHWVRIRLAEGKWVGGWWSGRSYMSTYPEPRDIYIEDQHYMDPDGKFEGPVEGSAGVWVAVQDGDIVEWIKPEES